MNDTVETISLEVAPVEAPQTWTMTGADKEAFTKALFAAYGVLTLIVGKDAVAKLGQAEIKQKTVQIAEFVAGVVLAAMKKAGLKPDLPVDAAFDDEASSQPEQVEA